MILSFLFIISFLFTSSVQAFESVELRGRHKTDDGDSAQDIELRFKFNDKTLSDNEKDLYKQIKLAHDQNIKNDKLIEGIRSKIVNYRRSLIYSKNISLYKQLRALDKSANTELSYKVFKMGFLNKKESPPKVRLRSLLEKIKEDLEYSSTRMAIFDRLDTMLVGKQFNKSSDGFTFVGIGGDLEEEKFLRFGYEISFGKSDYEVSENSLKLLEAKRKKIGKKRNFERDKKEIVSIKRSYEAMKFQQKFLTQRLKIISDKIRSIDIIKDLISTNSDLMKIENNLIEDSCDFLLEYGISL